MHTLIIAIKPSRGYGSKWRYYYNWSTTAIIFMLYAAHIARKYYEITHVLKTLSSYGMKIIIRIFSLRTVNWLLDNLASNTLENSFCVNQQHLTTLPDVPLVAFHPRSVDLCCASCILPHTCTIYHREC